MRFLACCCLLITANGWAEDSPYANPPAAAPPYYRVRYEASPEPGRLAFAVSYTIWLPPEIKQVRGVIVHQHGCGEGSCKSGQTGAFDLHWQALARKHACALLSPVYEQPQEADCQKWCDPRQGSDEAFQNGLRDLAALTGHPELAKVPWALWGHSGGGQWAGGMTLLHPDRVAAAWLRSGVPPVSDADQRSPRFDVPPAALGVPLLCNLGTKEGVSVREGRFAGVWPRVRGFFETVRGQGGLAGLAVDPLSSHDVGNQRYLAIPWLDACLTARLPTEAGQPLRPAPREQAWLAAYHEDGGHRDARSVPADAFADKSALSIWLPNESIAEAWRQYVLNTEVADATPPPAPSAPRLQGRTLQWTAQADLESGLAAFLIQRDGKTIARLPAEGKNPFGRSLFQNLSYSDTPTQPLAEMKYVDDDVDDPLQHEYRIIAVNTVGLQSR